MVFVLIPASVEACIRVAIVDPEPIAEGLSVADDGYCRRF